MKAFLLTLVCSIGIISAGVLDNIDEELSIAGQEGDGKANGRSGVQHISQMTHEDLVRQKFLLDILKHINEPIANEDLSEISYFANSQINGDPNNYNGGIDDDMSHVIERSRNRQLLNKNEPFTIANEEHMHQMIGLYRLLVGARDWTTLQEIIIHARVHINSALFVNALLLTIRDREDTQNLILPGIHEILPELYLDEQLIQDAKNLNLKQLDDAPTTRTATKTVGPHRPSILEMIGINKLLRSKSSKDVSSLDRHELWMPWRDMHKEVQARKTGMNPAQAAMSEDERIVVTAANSKGVEEGENELQLLTEDVGLQAFLQSFMSDLCLKETKTKQMGEQEMPLLQKRAGLDRVGLNRNVEWILKTGKRQSENEDMWNKQAVETDKDHGRLLPFDRSLWAQTNRDTNTNGNHDMLLANEQQMNQQQNGAQIGRVGLNRNMGSMQGRGIHSRYEQSGDSDVNIDADDMPVLPMGRRQWSQSNQDQSGTGLGHIGLNQPVGSMPQREARNRYEQSRYEDIWQTQNEHSGSDWGQWNQHWSQVNQNDDNKLYNHGWDDDTSNLPWLQRNSPSNDNQRTVLTPKFVWNSQRVPRINHQLLGAGLPTHTADETMRNQRRQQAEGDASEGHEIAGDKYGTNSHWSTGMPMDWNRQMAMHQQKSKMIDDQQRGYNLDGQQQARMGHTFREVDIDDERLLPLGRRNLKKLISSGQQESQQQKEQQLDDRRGTQGPSQRWMNEKFMKNAQGGNKNWLDSTGIDKMGQDAMGQHGLGSMDDKERWIAEDRGRQNTHWADENHNTGHAMMNNPAGQNTHWSDETHSTGRSMINNPGRQNTLWTDEIHNTDIAMKNKNTHWTDETYNMGRSMRPSRHNELWTGKSHNMDRAMFNNPSRQNMHWNDLHSQEEEVGIRMGMGNIRRTRSLGSWSNSATADHKRSIEQLRGGELLLHNLQQLVARINLEQLSLGLDETAEDIGGKRVNSLQRFSSAEQGFAARLNDMRLQTRRDRALLEQINEVEKHLQNIIQQQLEHKIVPILKKSVRKQARIDKVIGDMLMGKSMGDENEVNIPNILRAIMLQTEDMPSATQKLTQISLNIKDPVIRHLLRRIVHIADLLREEQLGAYRKEDLQAQGIIINEVQVDKLSTFVDTTEVDLINALDATQQRALKSDGQARMVVARQQRLNHRDFTIKIDVNAQRAQQVIVRTLLGPKIEGSIDEATAQLNAQRHNYILLDAHIVALRSGRNQIKRKSRDITWTAADTTPFSVAYKRVMRALNGEQIIGSLDQLQGQTCRFPHRLLLPRGRQAGLPMQILVVITPVEDADRSMQQWSLDQHVCGIGVGSANLDRLPLGFPLDRPIESASELLSLPNVHLMDVQIFHDKQVKVHDWGHDFSNETW